MSATVHAIDWTRPLRIVNGHAPARVLAIQPDQQLPVQIEYGQHSPSASRYWVSREGHRAGEAIRYVENVPPAPRIVERFALVGSNDYLFESGAMAERAAAEEMARSRRDVRIARVLIEEPGQ